MNNLENNCNELTFVKPTKSNGYRCFDEVLEENENIFFHVTTKSNMEKIVEEGFKSAQDQGEIGDRSSLCNYSPLDFVSYASKSKFVWSFHLTQDDSVIIAVKFDDVSNQQNITKDPLTGFIEVYNGLQPNEILGYVNIPKDFKFS